MKRNWLHPRVKWIFASILAVAGIGSAILVSAYNPFQDNVNNARTVVRWPNLPVTWYLNDATPSSNVSASGCNDTAANCIKTSLDNAFTTWTSTPLQTQSQQVQLTNLSVSFGGSSSATTPDVNDCKNIIGFSDAASDFSTGTIAFTQVATITAGGQTGPIYSYTLCGNTVTSTAPSILADADIEFNPSEQFYTTTAPSSGSAFSVQSVATHEEGHLLGLDHSGIGHAVMFPFGDTISAGQQLALSTDDVIGMGFLYPSQNFSTATGQISGTVSSNSSGAFAAHVVAIDVNTGNVVLDGLTNADGTYTLSGVPPGQYHVLVLPLAPDQSSGIVTLSDFSGWACGYGENSPPCCDPSTPTCTGTLSNPTNYTGRFF